MHDTTLDTVLWSGAAAMAVLLLAVAVLLLMVRRLSTSQRLQARSGAQLKDIASHIPGAVFQFYAREPRDYGLHYVSEGAQDLFGIASDAPDFFERFLEGLHAEDREPFLESIDAAVRACSKWDFQGRYVTADGSPLWFRGMSTPRRTGQEIVFNGVLLDITEQKRTEEQLENSRQSLAQILDSLPDAAFGIDLQGRVIFWNKTIESMTGVRAEDILGQGDYAYALPFYGERRPVMVDLVLHWNEAVARRYMYIKRQGDALVSETRNPPFRPDDSAFWNTARPLSDASGELIGAIQVMRDISEIKRTERELQQARNSIQNIINSMPSVLVTVNPEGTVTQWNEEAARVSGISSEEAVGRSLGEVLPEMAGKTAMIREAIRSRQTRTENKIPRQAGGTTRYENLTVYPLLSDGVEGAVLRVDDVTDQVSLERMMLQSEKMLTVGGLAAGMAHELNNPLAGILGNVDLLLRRLEPDHPRNLEVATAVGLDLQALQAYLYTRGLRTMIGRIRESAGRAGKIVNDMLFFSRTGNAKVLAVDICRLMDKALDLASTDYSLKKDYGFQDLEILREYEKRLPLVECEPIQMQQVFLNILANGAQAMRQGGPAGEERPPGRFVISIRAEDGQARIEIEDNGPGMPEAVRRRIFEPFFTTKEVGEGTGLGLSVSYFIVTEHHGGTMTVDSEPGLGSRFTLTLPLSQAGQGTAAEPRGPAA